MSLRCIKLFFMIFFVLTKQGFSEEKRNYKIYDCFPFFNELDILEIRLNELYDHVDKFVIVESDKTFTGKDKPLYFQENKERFSKFQDKIIYVLNLQPRDVNNPWIHDGDQKNFIMRALVDCEDDDIIINSDCDEILRGSDLQIIIKPIVENKTDIVVPILDQYMYFTNRYTGQMTGPTIVRYKYLLKHDPYYFRLKKDKIIDKQLKTEQWARDISFICGWHFTSMGWMKNYIFKLASYAHTESNIAQNRSERKILEIARTYEKVDIDDSFPKYLIDNIDHFSQLNFIDEDLDVEEAIRVYNEREIMNLNKFN